MYPILILIIGAISLTAGDILMKDWVNSSKGLFYVIGLLCYLIGMIFLAQSFKYKNIAIASLMLIFFNIIILYFVSWLWFKEPVSLLKSIGMILGLISVVIMEI
jgi:multidrug transporter EmrE-like cation transporter